MEIAHRIINVSGENRIYLYVTVDDIYEFGKENFGDGKDTNFLQNIREYAKNNLKEFSKAAVVLCINGVILGTITMSALLPKYNEYKKENDIQNAQIDNVQIYDEKENVNIYDENKAEEIVVNKQEENKQSVDKEIIYEKQEKKEEVINKVDKNDSTNTTTVASTKKPSSTASNKVTNVTKPQSTSTVKPKPQTTKPSTATQSQTATAQTTTSSTTKPKEDVKEESVNSSKTINFNNNGVISNIDLEEYVIGVVAAEMPASFNTEALKAQAIVARTYAMKKATAGITLVNSTSHQVYNSVTQMKAKWGSSFNTYYTKIKNAVNATKGQVLKYNGKYIDALYYAISNGKSELPKYVWNSSIPYLQAVSSNWDKDIAAGKHSVSMTYAKLSEKMGVAVDANTEIIVVSRTEGDRVENITIGSKTFTGVKIRSLLGLRSADFEIIKTDTGVTIITHGFGHGIGMSQYGANGAAKSGYTYKQILNHYYPSAVLTNI